MLRVAGRIPAALAILGLASLLPTRSRCADSTQATPEAIIQKVKQVERSAGFRSTGNFAHTRLHVRAYYRCYFTGPLELPSSYAQLKLRKGSRDGCSLDPKKYDIFFYPVEAVASGHTPVTESLAKASIERLATVVPHEDFHEQLRDLPDVIAEAAATLVGFLTGVEAVPTEVQSGLSREAEIFLQKSVMINRYYDQLSDVYEALHRGVLSRDSALRQKQNVLTALQQECTSIQLVPRSFNRCVPVANNAGLAFDHTYTKYYPLLHQVMVACRHDLKCTIETITRAPKKTSEAAVVQYFRDFLRTHATNADAYSVKKEETGSTGMGIPRIFSPIPKEP